MEQKLLCHFCVFFMFLGFIALHKYFTHFKLGQKDKWTNQTTQGKLANHPTNKNI